MQTIEEYKAYTKQLEGEVKTWHDAYDAIVIERNALVAKLAKYENHVTISQKEIKEAVKTAAAPRE